MKILYGDWYVRYCTILFFLLEIGSYLDSELGLLQYAFSLFLTTQKLHTIGCVQTLRIAHQRQTTVGTKRYSIQS